MFQNLVKKFKLDFCGADSPPQEILEKRKLSLAKFQREIPKSEMESFLPDTNFTNYYRVPFPYTEELSSLNTSSLFIDKDESKYDAFSSYGVNVFGKKFYEDCIQSATERFKEYGFFLNSVHPVALENISILQKISGLDSVSFHMSGTEAVLNACRLAKFATGKKKILKFAGAYHGWASIPDLVEIKNIKDLKKARNCAAILINPIQFLFPKGSIKLDAMLLVGNQPTMKTREEYSKELQEIKKICEEKKILFILDEVFLGFRLAYGGCQEFFQVKADLVTYGKTLGGGLPVGVVCGKKEYMNKFNSEYPLKFLANRGTFSAHPLVMLTMNEFLKRVKPELYANIDSTWNSRVELLNNRIKKYNLEFKNLGSILSIHHKNFSIYNWVLQLYLKKNKIYLGPYGSSRLVFQNNLSIEDWKEIENQIVSSIEEMDADGWLYSRFKSRKEQYYFYLKTFLKETFKYGDTRNLQT